MLRIHIFGKVLLCSLKDQAGLEAATFTRLQRQVQQLDYVSVLEILEDGDFSHSRGGKTLPIIDVLDVLNGH